VKTAAIYARVSSERQKEEQTIQSQTAALLEYAQCKGYIVPQEWIFEDEGYSGSNLVRPGLERIRDFGSVENMRIKFSCLKSFRVMGQRLYFSSLFVEIHRKNSFCCSFRG